MFRDKWHENRLPFFVRHFLQRERANAAITAFLIKKYTISGNYLQISIVNSLLDGVVPRQYAPAGSDFWRVARISGMAQFFSKIVACWDKRQSVETVKVIAAASQRKASLHDMTVVKTVTTLNVSEYI
jgi:hypothetical protein